MNNPDELDEERRLMYVAATRAEDNLYMLCPLERETFGYQSNVPKLSRFLADVPPGLYSGGEAELEPSSPVIPPHGPVEDYSASSPDPPPDGFSPGDRVSHPVFGLGRVVKRMNNSKIKIDFDHFGLKVLHLDYAGLKSAG
jgi:DNA helicase-2/ATP-dependent DNA helicase PcrA